MIFNNDSSKKNIVTSRCKNSICSLRATLLFMPFLFSLVIVQSQVQLRNMIENNTNTKLISKFKYT